MSEQEATGSAEQEFLADLKALGALHRDLLKRKPSLRTLARAVGVSPTSISKWLEGAQVPQQPDRLISVVRILKSSAECQVPLNSDLARILNSDTWLASHRRVMQERAAITAGRVQESNAKSEILRQTRQERLADLVDPPRPIADWTPAQLGVHPAIAGVEGISSLFVLPKYVTRGYDERLRMQLRAIASNGGVELILIRGESCTGKTRSAYEAIRECLPTWKLTFPKDSASLLSVCTSGVIEPRTVIWLNEAQNYLASDDKEACAAALRRTLERTGPVVIIMTLWPEYYRLLINEGQAPAGEVTQVKSLLAQASQYVVPNQLTDPELAILSHEAYRDPPLAAALKAAANTGRMTQILAAGPDLVDHYEHPSAPYGYYGKALIAAAMDARRFGVSEPLRIDFLTAAAPGYLTDSQRAEAPEDWAGRAVEYAQRRVKHVTSAFSPVPKSKGIGCLPGVVELADYLHHYGRKSRALLCPPETFWEAAALWEGDAESVEYLALAAMQRMRIGNATELAERAASMGASGALWELSFHCTERRDYDQADRILRQLGESGDPEAWVTLASMKEDVGQIQAAHELYIKAAGMGHHKGLREWAGVESINDREESALWIYRLLLSRGDTESYFGMASLLERFGELEEAEGMYRKAANLGDFQAMQALERLLESSGRKEEAQNYAVPESLQADSGTLLELMLSYEIGGKRSEADQIFWKLIDRGEEDHAAFLAWDRAAKGGIAGAERIAHEAAERGFTATLRTVVVQLMRDGNEKDTERLIERLAEVGETPLESDYSLYLERRGYSEKAEYIAASDERLGSHNLLQIARYRAGHGDVDSARKLTLRLIENGEPWALAYLAELEEMRGDLAESERLARKAVDAGELGALKKLSEKYPENEALKSLLRDGL
ncbi:hypothetical protein [Streptomyces sp. NPDC054783]